MDCVPSVPDLVRQLRAFHGYRTLWLDEQRQSLWHAEPEEELEALGYRYVATLMRPGPEALAEALARAGVRPNVAEADDQPTVWVTGTPEAASA
ncbi:MAG: hypothetical protein AAF799_31050 [Myxococcota bacterium]